MAEAALFCEAAAAGLGDDFLDDVQFAIDSVRDHPELGAIIPYSIIYAVEASLIVVIAVAHQRRAPRYWRSRT
jgi:hypothetical protein